MMHGEEKEVEIPFPNDYVNKEMAGKTVFFKVVLKGIKEKVVPEITDEFAKDVGQYGSLEELKEKIREGLLEVGKKEAKAELQSDICRKVAENNPIEVPEALVEAQVKASVANVGYRLAQQGVQLDNFDLNDPKIAEEMKQSAEKTVKEGLILEAIAEAEGIEANEKDLDSAVEEMAVQAGKNAEDIKKYYQQEGALEHLRMRIREEKTLDFLIQQARIKERAKKTKKK
jgi:trigger factor